MDRFGAWQLPKTYTTSDRVFQYRLNGVAGLSTIRSLEVALRRSW